jgi:mRNA interferase RelE/StbE
VRERFMSEFEIIYHPDIAAKDLPLISHENRLRIRKAIDLKLATQPHIFGERLRRDLKGYWKLRVGDYRVIYKIEKTVVIALRIGHRREVYFDKRQL